jgi:hypothetical protein
MRIIVDTTGETAFRGFLRFKYNPHNLERDSGSTIFYVNGIMKGWRLPEVAPIEAPEVQESIFTAAIEIRSFGALGFITW